MKKIFSAILGAALLCVACKPVDLYVEQNPYRTIVDYTPCSVTVDAPGSLTADAQYDWISFTQSGNSATFTLRRNTTGGIRTAEYTMSGKKDKLIIFQKAHGLDAKVSTSLVSQSTTTISLKCALSTSYDDDYSAWGLAYSETNDRSKATKVPQTSAVQTGSNLGTLTGLKENTDYFIWSYVQSTEGDEVYSDVLAVIPPVCVRTVAEFQSALDNAKEYSEVRVLGGLKFDGPIVFGAANKNKSISGGWNADFSEQSWDNLTVVDGQGKRGIICAADESGSALDGYAKVSYFEVTNCSGSMGVAILASGGPVTISNCYVHDNTCGNKGAIATVDGSIATNLTVANCKITKNYATGGHCAGICFGEGPSANNPVQGLVVNCLIYDNWCPTFGGYASALFVQNNSVVSVVNNTIVENFNYMDGGTYYQGIVLRDGTLNLFANNIIAGNTIAIDNQNPPVPFRHPNVIGAGSSGTTIVNNVYEGTWRGGDNVSQSGNSMQSVGFDLSTVYNPTTYMPVGPALGLGTFGTYTCSMGSYSVSVSVQDILDAYNTDLAGNPRVVNGKVDAGCYQVQ